ncbi:MAG TPA: class I SAM-dependent methyltransferase [Bacteroidales bacterium]|nr:class I SAM-dependent methyltransferase [Bacteroidales bacterium]HQI71447.1 class I SAM-dependent methyltransferase [Bacteroidales bacterium]
MIKKFLLSLYNFPFLSKEKTDANQKMIRDAEWDAIKPFIPAGSAFIDVGCGMGYAMKRAAAELQCTVSGIDPNPGEHGVGRYHKENMQNINIVQSVSENIPFADKTFDVVYCSHVLEHVDDEQKALLEMKRVLKPDGILIIGMPTAAMAWVNFFTNMVFTSHIRFFNVILKPFPFIHTGETKFIQMFIPGSHSDNKANTVFFDMRYYRVTRWKKVVGSVFHIQQTLLPALYPYPEFRQLFKMRKYKRISSSVFFIGKNR